MNDGLIDGQSGPRAARDLERGGRPVAAKLAIAGAILFVVLLVLLHLLRSDLDPSWHFVSEYELGAYGWMMQAAFCSLAIANFALLVSLLPELTGVSGWIARVLFALGSFGLILGGLFVPDAMNTAAENSTSTGMLHNLGGGLGLPGFVGTIIICVKLLRNPNWVGRRKAVMVATGVLIAAFLISFIGIASIAAKSQGKFGPDTPIGWPNRVGIVGGCVWVMLIARQVRRTENPES